LKTSLGPRAAKTTGKAVTSILVDELLWRLVNRAAGDWPWPTAEGGVVMRKNNATTINRLSDWIDDFKDSVSQFLGIVHFLLWLIWGVIVLVRVPEVYGFITTVIDSKEVASVKKPMHRKHVGFVSEAVAQQHGPPLQYPKQ
jgi:hypothetical protein